MHAREDSVSNALVESFSRWNRHPRKWDAHFVFDMLLRRYREARNRKRLLWPAIETDHVEILSDGEFRRSVAQVKRHTILDVARLANLWSLARLTGPGIFLEVGSYRGGSALHICNAIDARAASFYCFDPFEQGGFETLTERDQLFKVSDFQMTRYEAVVRLLSCKPNAKVIQGFFPSAAENLDLRDVAFCHLDVDVYAATKASLEYLASRLAKRSIIVLDDVNRNVKGVDDALAEFLANHPSFLFMPMFPSQGVLLSKPLW